MFDNIIYISQSDLHEPDKDPSTYNACVISDGKLKSILLYAGVWKLFTTITIHSTIKIFGDFTIQMGNFDYKEKAYTMLM